MLRYQFYPTLLNVFHRYQQHPTPESKAELIRKINRVPETDPKVLARFKVGVNFEEAVLKNIPEAFDNQIVAEARKLLPKQLKTQQLIQFIYQDIRFYGYADVVGEGRVIDLKSTGKYRPGKHDMNYQNLYLYGLREAGFRQMEYIISDLQQVYHETYALDSYDFSPLLHGLSAFAAFVEDNKNLITDSKIIIEKPLGELFA